MRARTLLALSLLSSATLVAACGSDSEEAKTSSPATAASCAKDKLTLLTPGKLTIATDKPAYPPYFEDDDPTNGKGFESAVAYAIADELGFEKSEVAWKVVPFNASFKPGKKDFDFDVNQISITEPRQKAVDFSSPYFTAPQAVLALEGSDAAKAKTLADLKDAKLGVQVATTSLDAATKQIAPSTQPQVFDDSNATVQALKTKKVDAIVVDLPTALYLNAAEVDGSVVVGQFDAPGGDQWGAVLEKDSPLTACVNQAIEKLDASGKLDELTDTWITKAAGAPKLS